MLNESDLEPKNQSRFSALVFGAFVGLVLVIGGAA
jgi:hypothetical protein